MDLVLVPAPDAELERAAERASLQAGTGQSKPGRCVWLL